MISFSSKPRNIISLSNTEIASFLTDESSENIDWTTVKSFGEEWKAFDQFSQEEIDLIGNEYFDIVPDSVLNKNCVALDLGCGSGRWTRYVCEKAKFVEAVDPSEAVFSAASLLKEQKNVRITQAASSDIPFPDNSFDFVFSLGVLHHIPDTGQAMKDCVAKLKQGGCFLVYLYYKLDNKSLAYKLLFHLADIFRRGICRLPSGVKKIVCDLLAVLFYLPFIGIAKLVKKLSPTKNWFKQIPLWYYHNKTWNVIRNDSLDRFGTPLEQRFSKLEIQEMMENAGLKDIVFSDNAPYWHAVGFKN